MDYKDIRLDELQHFGIIGQKWGVRRFENYDGTLTEEGKERYYGNNGYGYKIKRKPGEEHYSETAVKLKRDADLRRQIAKYGGITIAALGTAAMVYTLSQGESYIGQFQDQAYAAIMGGVLAAAGFKNEKHLKTYKQKLEETADFKSLKDIPKARVNYSKNYFGSDSVGAANSKELRAGINPDFPKRGANANCMLCTTAMVMRLKGYDVKANKVPDGFPTYTVEDWFDNCQTKVVKGKNGGFIFANNKYDTVLDALKADGNGSYGNLMVKWTQGGGHSILYTVKNNKVQFIDGQSNQVYSAHDLFNCCDMNEVAYVRLNDATPKEDVRLLVAMDER